MNNNTQKGFNFIALFVFFFTSLCLSEGSFAANSSISENDPYEGFNRAMFNFNERLDEAVLKPVATFYNVIVPKPLNRGIHNVFNNLGNLPTIANDLLQVNFHQAANDFWRFGINSTVGIGGLFDVATTLQLPAYNNDFGLTLARWGYEQSNYLVLPFFGPSSIRDGISLPVDYFAFSIYPYIGQDTIRYGLYSLGVIDRRARLLQYQPILEEAAIDKYTFVRNAYRQHRSYQVSTLNNVSKTTNQQKNIQN